MVNTNYSVGERGVRYEEEPQRQPLRCDSV